MAARRSTGPAGLRNAGGRGGGGGGALLIRPPVALGDGEGQSTVSRWAMALCEEFVHKLYRALRGAMAVISALWLTGRGDKAQPGTEASASRSQHGRRLAPVDASRKQNSYAPGANPAKRSSRQGLGPEACSAPARTAPTAAAPPAAFRRNSATRRMPAPPTTAATTTTTPPGQTRSGENNRAIWPSRCKLTSSRLTSPKASASAPAPTSPKNPCPGPLSSSSDALTTTVPEECKKSVPESELGRLYKQAVELFNAVVLVLMLLVNLTTSLICCVMRVSVTGICNAVARHVFSALLLI